MAIDVTWGDEKQTLIHAIFLGEWDWYEFYAAAGEISQLMQTSGPAVDVILDMQNSKRMPNDLTIHLQRVQFFQSIGGTTVIVQNGVARQPIPERLMRIMQPDGKCGKLTYANDLYEAQIILSTKQPV